MKRLTCHYTDTKVKTEDLTFVLKTTSIFKFRGLFSNLILLNIYYIAYTVLQSYSISLEGSPSALTTGYMPGTIGTE